jgi:mono/diheme cytochrome c family protein
MRQPPAGSVPFGAVGFVSQEAWAQPWMRSRADHLRADGVLYTGKGADGAFVAKAPIKFTAQDLARGQERYNISCSACHNYNGDGLGAVGRQWSYPLPNFHDAKYTDTSADQGRDGYIFHVIRNGVLNPDGSAKMPAYAHAMDVDDSWRIVAYVRAMQAAMPANLRPAPVTPAPAAATPATPTTPTTPAPGAATPAQAPKPAGGAQ